MAPISEATAMAEMMSLRILTSPVGWLVLSTTEVIAQAPVRFNNWLVKVDDDRWYLMRQRTESQYNCEIQLIVHNVDHYDSWFPRRSKFASYGRRRNPRTT
jgi:hypothetical protein